MPTPKGSASASSDGPSPADQHVDVVGAEDEEAAIEAMTAAAIAAKKAHAAASHSQSAGPSSHQGHGRSGSSYIRECCANDCTGEANSRSRVCKFHQSNPFWLGTGPKAIHAAYCTHGHHVCTLESFEPQEGRPRWRTCNRCRTSVRQKPATKVVRRAPSLKVHGLNDSLLIEGKIHTVSVPSTPTTSNVTVTNAGIATTAGLGAVTGGKSSRSRRGAARGDDVTDSDSEARSGSGTDEDESMGAKKPGDMKSEGMDPSAAGDDRFTAQFQAPVRSLQAPTAAHIAEAAAAAAANMAGGQYAQMQGMKLDPHTAAQLKMAFPGGAQYLPGAGMVSMGGGMVPMPLALSAAQAQMLAGSPFYGGAGMLPASMQSYMQAAPMMINPWASMAAARSNQMMMALGGAEFGGVPFNRGSQSQPPLQVNTAPAGDARPIPTTASTATETATSASDDAVSSAAPDAKAPKAAAAAAAPTSTTPKANASAPKKSGSSSGSSLAHAWAEMPVVQVRWSQDSTWVVEQGSRKVTFQYSPENLSTNWVQLTQRRDKMSRAIIETALEAHGNRVIVQLPRTLTVPQLGFEDSTVLSVLGVGTDGQEALIGRILLTAQQ